MHLRHCIAFLAILALGTSGCGGPQVGRSLVIATATTGGTYYPVGVGIGTLLSRELAPDIAASAVNSAGSGENIQMLVNDEAQLAILQGLYGAMAFRGTGAYAAPVPGLRSVTVLWRNVEHFLLNRRKIRSGDLSDVLNLGDKYSIGKRGSGTEGSTRVIFDAVGIDAQSDIVPEYLGYTPSAQAMMDGRIIGASIPAGPPVAAVTQVFAQMGGDGVGILAVTDAQLAKVRAAYPVWTRFTLAAGTYPGQDVPVATIAQPNFLACRADLPDDVVYKVTKAIYENLGYLRDIHQATAALRLEDAIEGLAVPLHPGAARYYREQGIEIPPELLPGS